MEDTNLRGLTRIHSVKIRLIRFCTARTTMMKLCSQAARIWSAVTCHRFCCFGDLSPKQGRVQRPGTAARRSAFDGDKSPAESADKSAHSRAVAASPRSVHPWFQFLLLVSEDGHCFFISFGRPRGGRYAAASQTSDRQTVRAAASLSPRPSPSERV